MTTELLGKRFVAPRRPVWRALGTTIPENTKPSADDALRIGGIDFEYRHVPVGYTTPDGTFTRSGERNMILRSPTPNDPHWREMGVVSADYAYIQNVDLIKGLETITNATGWRFDTVGCLDLGRTIFTTIRTGKRSVLGDSYETYLVVSDGKASDRALQISVIPMRMTCLNMINGANTRTTAKITIAHDQFVRSEYDYWLGLIEQLERAQDETYDDLERMASVKIKEKTAVRIIELAMPFPGKTSKAQQADALLGLKTIWNDKQRSLLEVRSQHGEDRKQTARMQVLARRGAALDLYKRFNVGEEEGAKGGSVLPAGVLKELRETPYAVVQAISELVDHGGIAKAEVAAASAMFGLGADVKQRAWSAAMKHVSR